MATCTTEIMSLNREEHRLANSVHKNVVARAPVYGTFTMHTITPDPVPDPLDGPYLGVPTAVGHVDRTFPLVSAREQIFGGPSREPWAGGREFLRQHGVGAFQHKSKVNDLPRLLTDGEARAEYYAELRELIKSVLQCKEVFVTSSVTRTSEAVVRDPPRTEDDITPAKLNGDEPTKKHTKGTAKYVRDLTEHEDAGQKMRRAGNTEPYHLPTVITPSRIPHTDYTPLGARQLVRSMLPEMHRYASVEANVIPYEENLCASAPETMSAVESNSNARMWELYNQPGKPGPRYGVFSIWRPLKKCTRDPIAFTTSKDLASRFGGPGENKDLEYFVYDLRTPGFQSDWLWNLAMLRASPEHSTKTSNEITWYYVPDQTPDEVLFIKHFDSASLGPDATEAPAAIHGSPDLGDAGYGPPRESIEARAVVFW